MKTAVRVLSTALALSLVLGANQAQAFWLPTFGQPGQVTFSLNPNILHKANVSKVSIYNHTSKWGYPIQDCFDATTSPCDLSSVNDLRTSDGGVSAQAEIVYPVCSQVLEESCIEEVSIGFDSKGMTGLLLDHYSHNVQSIPIDEFPGLPAGGSVPVFKLPRPQENGAIFMAVKVTARYSYSKASGQFEQDTLHAVMVPITFRSASRPCQPGWKSVAPFDADPLQRSRTLFTDCFEAGTLFTSGDVSAYPENFLEETRIQLKIRIANSVGGWFSGQFGDVQAKLETINASQNVLTIAADVAKVPQLKVVIPEDQIKPDGIKLGEFRSVYEDRVASLGNFGGYSSTPGGYGTVDAILALREIARDTSSAENVVWSFQSADRWAGTRCKDVVPGITGIIATNAMAYDGYQPKFTDGTFDFKVAGMHYNSDGTTAVGSYDLLLRSEFARCIYGFTKAPISGSVSVLNENGDPSVATTLVSEADGFIKLSAKGFTFSEKKIVGKLTQKESSITCQRIVKKKVKETRTLKGSVCPKGFVKKK